MRVVVKDGRREAERLESPPLGWYRRELRTWTTALPLLPLLLVLSVTENCSSRCPVPPAPESVVLCWKGT